jgi:hypothetical protein
MQAMPIVQATAAPAQTAQPSAAPAPVAVQVPGQGTVRPLTREEVRAIQSARNELSNQLTSAERRRSRLVQEMQGTDGQVRTGLEQRLAVLDERIAQIERDIAITGRQLTDAPRERLVGTTSAPDASRSMPLGIDPDLVMGVGTILMFVFLVPVALAWTRMWWRRGGRAQATPATDESNSRLERIEQAVDAIAIEIERVSESQRYQARLLGEGQGLPPLVSARPGESVRAGYEKG